MAQAGFTRIRRHEIPFAWEFATPADYARSLASTGPAYEAILAVGETEFLHYAEVAWRCGAGLRGARPHGCRSKIPHLTAY